MSMSRIRLVPIVVVAVIALAVLFGGWQFYQHYSVVSPLQTDLQTVKGVKTSEVQPGDPSTINVSLGAVPDLQTTYKQILQKAKLDIRGPISVNISGNTDTNLSQVYEEVMPTLMEGVAKGNFTEMIKSVTQITQSKGISTHITMDSQHIFIQMTKGSHDLYSILPYSLQRGVGAS